MDTINWEIANKWWDKNNFSFQIPYYSINNLKPKMVDGDMVQNFKNIKDFILFFDKYESLKENDAFYQYLIKMSNNWSAIFSAYDNLKQELLSPTPNENSLSSLWGTFVNYWNNYNHGFIHTKSMIYKQIIQLNKKWKEDANFIFGYVLFFTTAIPSVSSYVEGWSYAAEVNNYFSIIGHSDDILKKVVTAHQKRDVELDAKIIQLDEEKNKIDQQRKVIIKNFDSQFSKIKHDLENEKGNLMLSGPIEIWHTRLEEYTGYKYKRKEKEGNTKAFEFDKESSKILWRPKTWGKITRGAVLSVIWAIVGLFLGLGSLLLAIKLDLPKELRDHAKSTIIISVVGSFLLFVYGYILRIAVKNWNSAKHIAESIEERISLTQFYLALKQDGEEQHTKIALKEIFSKINTGLIKEEHDIKANILERITK